MDILSWKFPPLPRSMLDVRTQSMDANFYCNIERGRGGIFFPTFETKVVVMFLRRGSIPGSTVLNRSDFQNYSETLKRVIKGF